MSLKNTNEKGYADLIEFYIDAIQLRIDFILQYQALGNIERIKILEQECYTILKEAQLIIQVDSVRIEIIKRFNSILVDSEIYQEYRFYLN